MRTIILAFAALLGLLAQPGIAQVYDPYTGPDPVAPSLRLMAEPFAAAEALGPVSVSIRSLNAQTFPFVFLDVDATDETGTCPLFSAENFQVLEDGVAQTDYFAVTPPNENQGVRLVDIVFIMDNSGSMSDDQLAVRNNVYGFVDKLTQGGINFAFGLTRYGQGASSGAPLIQDNGNLTSDAAYFKDTVWTRNTIDGGTEPGYWSIVESAAKFNYRPGSRRVFIIITDESPNQGGATLDQAAAALQSGDVTLFAVTTTTLFTSFQTLVADPTQQLLGLTTSFDQIFTAVTDLLADTYRVTYKAQNETIDGLERTVEVLVTCGADSGSDTTTYMPGSEPKIARNQETIDLSATTQPAQTALTIAAQVTDQAEPFVQPGGVRLYYRPTSTNANAPYKSIAMPSIGVDTYSAAIPAAEVSEPGIDYYISATDGVSTATDPTVDASARPYTIAVFPNEPPVLLHTVVTEAQVNTPILICAQAYDTTQTLVEISLHYRKKGELSYQTTLMQSATAGTCATGGSSNNYQATIPLEQVTLNGVEYFIDAVDNYNTRTTSGSASQPNFIRVTTEPVVPILAVTPTTALNFGSVPVGEPSPIQDYTVRNTGGGLLSFACSVEPPFYLAFPPCTYTDIAPSEFADVPLYFRPGTEGPVVGTAIFQSNGGDTSRTLSGTGTPAATPVIDVSPAGLSFEPQVVNTPSAAKTVTIANVGGATLVVGNLTLNGANPEDYQLEDSTCSSRSLDSGLSCTFSITFRPTLVGTRTASVSIPSNDAGSPTISLSLAGLGESASITFPAVFGVPPEFQFAIDLQQGVTNPSVRYLQIMLNADPDTRIIETAQDTCWDPTYIAGAPGCETQFFGAQTQAAVVKFQTKHLISPTLGFVGPKTQAKLNELLALGLAARRATLFDRAGRESAISASVSDEWLTQQMPAMPKKLALAVPAHETGGGYAYNNEWLRVVASSQDFGRGIMQVTTSNYVGAGSGSCDSIAELSTRDACKACKAQKNTQYQCSKYYTNTADGIRYNITDGLSALKTKYDSVHDDDITSGEYQCGDNKIAFSGNDMINISALARYNGVINTAPSIFLVSEGKTNAEIVAYFLDKKRSAPGDEFLSNVRETCGFEAGTDGSEDFLLCLRQCSEAGLISNYLYLSKVAASVNILDTSPDTQQLGEKLSCADTSEVITWIASPAELALVDGVGRESGEVNGVGVEEVPNTIYDEETKLITQLFPTNDTRYRVTGVEYGTYGLIMVRPGTDTMVAVRDIPIAPGAIHEYEVGWEGSLHTAPSIILSIDGDGDGFPEQRVPIGDRFSDNEEPTTTQRAVAETGQNGWYRSDVIVTLSPNDGDGIGVQFSAYSVDRGAWNIYDSSKGISITSEGVHSLSFYSVDYFGNQEAPKTVTIKIDKIAPEASISVDPTTKDLKVLGIDGQSEVDFRADANGNVTLTDEAGHTTKLLFKRTYSGKLLTFAQLTGIQYDGAAPVSLPKTTLVYVWKPRSSPPQLLSQTIVVNGSFTIQAAFNPRTNKTTVIVVKKGAAPQKFTFAGQKIVKLKSKNGVLDYEL